MSGRPTWLVRTAKRLDRPQALKKIQPVYVKTRDPEVLQLLRITEADDSAFAGLQTASYGGIEA